MVLLEINNTTYKAIELWNELTLKEARELFRLANTAPEELLYIYKEQAKGKDADKDQIALKVEELKEKEKELDSFFKQVFLLLSDTPKEVTNKIAIEDIRAMYAEYLMKFVFGVLHYPLEERDLINSFKYAGTTYYAPKSKKVMGLVRPFYDEDTYVFCDASDLDKNGRKSEYGKYQMAELIIAIIFKERGQRYIEEEAMDVADIYFNDDITCDIFHAALHHLSLVNSTLKQLFPNLYESAGDIASVQAASSSGLSDFGWLNSILTIAKMQLLNQQGMTPLASVQKTNLYDFMTVLSNHRADNDFKEIYRDNIRKK